jgi:hypothetical protein
VKLSHAPVKTHFGGKANRRKIRNTLTLRENTFHACKLLLALLQEIDKVILDKEGAHEQL